MKSTFQSIFSRVCTFRSFSFGDLVCAHALVSPRVPPLRTVDVESNSRGLETLTSTAAMCGVSLSDGHTSWLSSQRARRGRKVCLAQRWYDATPVALKFGALKPLIERRARFLIKDQNVHGREIWKAVSYEKYKEKYPRGDTTSGVLELLGVAGSVVVSHAPLSADLASLSQWSSEE